MVNNIERINDKNCMGCFACFNICSKNAIRMDVSSDGFYKPKIDGSKCDNCRKCLKVCPVINNSGTNREKEEVKVYSGWTNNNKIIQKSSSGGIFYEIANIFLNKGFKIIGAKFDDNLELITKIADNKKQLESLLGSKYIPSYVGKTFNKIATLLEKGKKVIFCGTPCQVEGLKLFLKEKKIKRNKNLFFISFICHGVGSLKIFEEYLAQFEGIDSINFRDKTHGWKDYSIKLELKNGEEIIEKKNKNDFFRVYFKKIILNDACYKCKFASIPRVADITLGDYWNPPEKFDNYEGASVILSNNEYGDNIIKLLHENNLYIEKISIDSVLEGNPRVYNSHFSIPKQRRNFFYNYKSRGYRFIKRNYLKNESIYKKIFKLTKKIIIKIFRFIKGK